MALIKCPECKSKVSDKAKACPSCGMGTDPKKARQENDVIEDIKKSKLLKIALVIGGLAIISSLFTPKKDKACDNLGAYILLQSKGANYFKSPSTVKFASYPYASIVSNDCNTYNIKTYADAQNAYGATIRSNVVAKVLLDKNKRSLIDIQISE